MYQKRDCTLSFSLRPCRHNGPRGKFQSRDGGAARIRLGVVLFAAGAIFTARAAHAQSYTLSTLASFTNDQGPSSTPVMDSSGNLYATMAYGGASGDGLVFKIAAGTNTITTLASFNGFNGNVPNASLTMDGKGDLFGTTFYGGATGEGTIFEIDAGTNAITPIASFNGGDGSFPESPLIVDGSGNLYGTAYSGGSSSDGTFFEVASGSKTITTLASFNGGDGAGPLGGLVMDKNGDLFGTAVGGDGTVFEIAAGTNTITTFASFNGANGEEPSGGLVMDGVGNLYGTTDLGGSANDGTLFEIAAGTNTITTLANFNGANGQHASALVMDDLGDLFGTTAGGGSSNVGTVFEIASSTNTITTLANFNFTGGYNPDTGLYRDSGGNLYGVTYAGGSYGDATVYELTPNGAASAPEPETFALFLPSTLSFLGFLRRRIRQ